MEARPTSAATIMTKQRPSNSTIQSGMNSCVICQAPAGLDDYCDAHSPDNATDDRIRRLALSCSYCPHNRCENRKSRADRSRRNPNLR